MMWRKLADPNKVSRGDGSSPLTQSRPQTGHDLGSAEAFIPIKKSKGLPTALESESRAVFLTADPDCRLLGKPGLPSSF